MFQGAFTALVTPFSSGSIDEKSLRDHIEFQVKQGIHGVVPCGTTGEASTLSHDEHVEVVRITVDQVGGRVPVIAGSGSNSTAEALELTRRVKEVGADGSLMITPYYNKPTQEGLYQHFSLIAESVDIPIILYNVPGRTGVNMLAETVGRLSKIPNIVGLKDATGDLVQASYTLQVVPDDFVILSGEDAMVYPLLTLGGKGVISVVSNVAPAEMAKMVSAYLSGNIEDAQKLHYRLLPLSGAMFVETNPIPVKGALSMMGRIKNELRLPLVPLSETGRQKVKDALKAFGIALD
ncbi:MAG: 4-hydroxy-tetrahydrodipicolinate synthase [bacterium]|nr:MAG: 4-hydroxy-tetrahydrodipicolinate synthase [bacterium]